MITKVSDSKERLGYGKAISEIEDIASNTYPEEKRLERLRSFLDSYYREGGIVTMCGDPIVTNFPIDEKIDHKRKYDVDRIVECLKLYRVCRTHWNIVEHKEELQEVCDKIKEESEDIIHFSFVFWRNGFKMSLVSKEKAKEFCKGSIPFTDMINRSNFVATTIWELNEYGE